MIIIIIVIFQKQTKLAFIHIRIINLDQDNEMN